MKSLKPFPFPKSRPLEGRELLSVYRTLRRALGHQHWWPGRTPFEIMVGAVLTQNAAWTNVEGAIRNLRRAGKLTPRAMRRLPADALAALIRPAGYFNVKADRLRHLVGFLYHEYGGNLRRMFRERGETLRAKLLAVHGIGPETADSILLYAAGKPFFVIDAYTKRVFARHRLRHRHFPRSPASLLGMGYEEWQKAFVESLPRSVRLYNDFHAQIVTVGKQFCKLSGPRCELCPLGRFLI